MSLSRRFRAGAGLACAVIALCSGLPARAGQAPITLPGDHLHPESVSILPDAKGAGATAWVGSMTGGVLKVRLPAGTVERFIAPGAYGSGALFGVLADRRNGLLWTCTNSFPAPLTQVPGADAGHWAKAFDLKTGVGKVSLTLPGDHPVCNDFAVGKDGAVYITDTGQPRILRWKPGATALEIWVENPIFEAAGRKGGLDGLAFGGDGQLYVNNVRDGSLYRVEVKPDGSAGGVVRLNPSRPVQSPDGMRPLGGQSFILAEGSAGRVARLTVKGDAVEVETLAEGIKEPTGVDSLGQTGFYVQGQLSGLFSPDKAPPVQLPFRLVPLALSK